MSLATIIQTIIGAGIGSAIIQGLLPILRDHWAGRSRATYLAMRLAVILEAFSAACLDLVTANEDPHHPPDQPQPNWKARLPELANFPHDAEGWRSLDRKLAGRSLGFRNKVNESQGVINDIIQYNEDAIGDTVEREAVARGLEAWRLALELRKRHGIEAAEPVWSYIEALERLEKRHKSDG